MNARGIKIREMKKLKALASDEDLIKELGIDKEDTWHGYHGRQKQTRPKRKKLYFKIHEESFD